MTTTIGSKTRIDGRLEGEGDVVVHGRVDGTVVLTDTLTVAEGGFVSGDIEARVLVIEGAASGTLRAGEVVHLTSTAQVEAEIFATAIRLDPGAALKGRVEMDVDAAPPRAKRPERPARKPASSPTRATSEDAPASETASSSSAPSSSKSSAAKSSASKSSKSSGTVTAASPSATTTSTTTLDVDPDELTVKELREQLMERDLPVSGTKSELIERLRNGE